MLAQRAVRGMLATVDKADVVRKLGVLSAQDFAIVEQSLTGILGFRVATSA